MNLIQQSIAKATGKSQNDVINASFDTITLDQAYEAVKWAIETHHDNILGLLRDTSKSEQHKYGFDLAIDIVNDYLD